MMSLVQVIDVGTTNIKSGIVDKKGNIVAHETRPLELKRPEPRAAEHDPEELVQALCEIADQTNRGYESDIGDLVLTGYLFGFLPLDENKEPLTGIITLLDERPKSVMKELVDKYPAGELYQLTGCPPLFIYTFAKILWLQEEKPDIYRRTKYFGDLKSFLVHKLTGEFVTETSTASATQLYNVHKGTWDEKVLNWLDIEKGSLPGLRAGDQMISPISPDISERIGLDPETSLFPGVYDGGAMMLGMGGYEGDDAICNLGTTAMLRKCSSRPVLDDEGKRRLQTYQLLPDLWVVGGSLNNAGIALKWFRDKFSPEESYREIVQSAKEIEPGSDGLIFLPFLTGERDPRMGNLSSGLFFGLKNHHSKKHLVRAVMEGVVYALGLVLRTMREKEITVSNIVIGGSGSKGTLWAQMVADILEVPVRKSITEDATLIGGAMLVYNESDTYSSLSVASENMVSKGKKFYPRESYFNKYRNSQKFFVRLVKEVKPLFEEHSRLVLEK
ncbi:gluconokinase [Candidatus Bipolaricaulota bacterium]|nr:gluconokinase [Candidatus Bipolaricaulota bacterium]